ncbi:hypothetical protein HELRODRAFT_193953 [Helobdella robusta]|uniref:Aquaporin n=1 Tax=Helobdella robusta TaxID=6412 RepID=T1FVI6_HELRO|nr:hypothetical protein HELRODRAFT_193953 [Helobdella robusta]ESN93758.1 hypothetical protein HELRODRAFT_193953 [Helobdella robusta]
MTRLLEDVKHFKFWRCLLAEFVGSMVLVLVGCGAWIHTPNQEHPDSVRIALAFGLTYTALLYVFKSISEGQIVSSVTLALLATRRTSVMRSLLYLVGQLLGAVLGASFVFGVTSFEQRNSTYHRIESHAFGVEFFATFFFVFVFFACYDKKAPEDGGVPESVCPFLIGVTFAAASLFAIPFSGASMNPSRSFGPALIGGVWSKHWVYWFGPILGGVFGGALYDLFFSQKASFERLKSCFLVFHRKETPQQQQQQQQPINHQGGDEEDERRDVEAGLKHHARNYQPIITAKPPKPPKSDGPKRGIRFHQPLLSQHPPPPLPPPPNFSSGHQPTCLHSAKIKSHFTKSPNLTDSPNYANVSYEDFLKSTSKESAVQCNCAVPY